MKCRNHKEEEAKYICDKCKMPICEECATEIRGNKVCISCIDQSLYAEADRVERIGFFNKLMFLIFACIPGAAHMQMGLFKRGMQLMFTFIGSIVLLTYANIDSFIPLIIIPTWFFSLFDAYSTRKKLFAGEIIEDTEAYNYQFIIHNKKILGSAMLILGCIGVLNALVGPFEASLRALGLDSFQFVWALRRGIIPFVLVIGGIMLLTKLKKSEKEINE